jgi:hypothetical protein
MTTPSSSSSSLVPHHVEELKSQGNGAFRKVCVRRAHLFTAIITRRHHHLRIKYPLRRSTGEHITRNPMLHVGIGMHQRRNRFARRLQYIALGIHSPVQSRHVRIETRRGRTNYVVNSIGRYGRLSSFRCKTRTTIPATTLHRRLHRRIGAFG